MAASSLWCRPGAAARGRRRRRSRAEFMSRSPFRSSLCRNARFRTGMMFPNARTTFPALAGILFTTLVVGAQPPTPVQTPPAPPRRMDYPTRPAGDPAAIERGKALYSVNCQFCHGADTRGGDSGPSLLRAAVVLDDRNGELMAPIIQNGRPERGMPKFAFSREQVSDVAAFIHTFKAAGYDESRLKPPSIIVGDAKAGEAFFSGKCAACHSATGDLRGIAAKIPDER